MSTNNVLLVCDREHATILNALRFWQAAGRPAFPEYFEEIPGGPVAEDDVDAFIERINADVTLSILLTIESGIVCSAYVPGAADNIAINVIDLDTDGVDEEDLEELQLPFLGIQSGTTYSVARNIEAREFLELLDRKWTAEADSQGSGDEAPALDLLQCDLFVSTDEVAADELSIESSDRTAEVSDA